MNDNSSKTVSTLAIAEKKPHRPGGCVGIFFQLFDWNRRFAKKKLFSRKLLPPARAKQASKKFGGDEKLPKFRLIADENSGGFPSMKRSGTHDGNTDLDVKMQAPGLLARLMGLESMPAVQKDKSKKTPFSETVVGERGEKFGKNQCAFSKEDIYLEKGGGKQDLRPQKLQKIGPVERRPGTRFGAEALQFKSVLSRSRKHHPKLASPVKSPRGLSGRNSSRLIDVATKILDPRLHATNRAKYALTYANTTRTTPEEDIMVEGTRFLSPDLPKNSDYHVGEDVAIKCQSSCKNCGNLVDVMDSRLNSEQQAPNSNSSLSIYGKPSEVADRYYPRPTISSLEQGGKLSCSSLEQSTQLGSRIRENVQARSEAVTNKKPFNQEGQIHWNLSRPECKPQRNEPSSVRYRSKTETQNNMQVVGDRVPSSSRFTDLQSNRVSSAANVINETRNFVALNRSRSGNTRTRRPANLDDSKFETERKSFGRRDDSLSPVRKRRSTGTGRHSETSGFVSSTIEKQRNVSCISKNVRRPGCNADSLDGTCSESRSLRPLPSNRTNGNKDNNAVSFTFNSSVKQKIGRQKMVEKRSDQNGNICSGSRLRKTTLIDNHKQSSYETFPLTGDVLGAILEQKLKELTCQEDDELETGGNPPKRTTAMILQELISALTAERPLSEDDLAVGSSRKDIACCNEPTNDISNAKAKTNRQGASVAHSCDIDHFSPGSILEASFSNDSCISSSLDDHSGHRHPNSPGYSNEESQQREPDADLLDSATSLSKGTAKEFVTDLLSLISHVLCQLDFPEAEFSESKLCDVKEVILNSEMLFSNASLHNSDGNRDFSVCRFLLDDLGTIANIFLTDFSSLFSFEENKQGNRLKGFVFDSVIEYLDSRYVHYQKTGFKGLTKVPLRMNAEILIHEVVEEVRRWTDLAGLITDELIEWEMSHSLGKWMDFEVEAFETGAEFDDDILQILVDEIVVDLWGCNLGSS